MSGPAQRFPAGGAANFAWVASPPVRKIVAALQASEPDGVRFVGGCVRDGLLGETPKDIDIATVLTPSETMAALKAAGLGAAPTGIEHGTITAIADHVGVEVTSLRADVSTDGRRASVAFTRDWTIDAQRRDFTINAIYLTPSLDIADPVGGLADLAARHVRFIGRAGDRINEDYLRILRFFRFSTRFAETFDPEGLAACAARREGVKRLSPERIGDELTKLLELPSPHRAIAAMQATGILAEIWDAPPDVETLARLKTLDPQAGAPLGLAALWGSAGAGVDARLRLSNADGLRRRRAVENAPRISPSLSERQARALLYAMGADAWRDACLLAEAIRISRSDAPAGPGADHARLLSLPSRWTVPVAPFSGRVAIAAGLEQGPRIAAVIAAAEARWIDEDFPPQPRAGQIFEEEIARAISKG